VDGIGEQFFNELTKREIGRQKCLEKGCTHFMSMDADEYYVYEQLEAAKDIIMIEGYDATACWYGKVDSVFFVFGALPNRRWK
jgi:hypothetical protein